MTHPDIQAVVRSSLIVAATAADIYDLASLAPADRSTIVLIGHILVLMVIGSFVVSIDVARQEEQRALHLLPQTQLALWLLGILGVVMATDGFHRFHPTEAAWVFTLIALTAMSRTGFVWLWQMLALGLKRG